LGYHKIKASFGGRLMVFVGDLRQVLPVMSGASRAHVVRNCLNRASYWPEVKRLKLQVNMRVQLALCANDANLTNQFDEFADYLLRVGEGKIPTVMTIGV